MKQPVNMSIEEKYMKIAIELSKKGNLIHSPYVGCVVVKSDKIIGKGFYEYEGAQHAEVMAFKNIPSNDANKSTVYVTVEPCSVYSRTPPCTRLLIEKGIEKVVMGMLDPNPLTKGRSIKKFKENNIDFQIGIYEQEIIKLNQNYINTVLNNIDNKECFKYRGVLSLCGLPGSGKSQISRIVKSMYDIDVLDVSSKLRSISIERYGNSNRNNLIKTREKIINSMGKTGVLELALSEHKLNSDILLIDSVRILKDIELLYNKFSSYSKTIGVIASKYQRYQRIKERSNNNISHEEFISRDKWEKKIGVTECIASSDYVINNLTDLSNLKKQIHDLLDHFYLL